MDTKPDFSTVLQRVQICCSVCVWLHVKGERVCLWASVHVYMQTEWCMYVCLFLTSCWQIVTCRRWLSSMSTQTSTKALKHFFLFTCLLDFITNIYHIQTSWSDIIVAEIRIWLLRRVLFRRIETNKCVFMKALLTDRVAFLLWGIKLATDGDLWPLL